MATTTERPTQPAGGEAQPPGQDRRMGRERPVGGFELWAWLFMRISGIVLLLLAVGHTLIMHLPSGGVDRVDFGFVATRWNSPFWRTWDWMLLILALIHGINGLRNITLDYVRRPGVRLTLNMLFYVLGFTLFILGTVIVVTFDPDAWGPVG
jgi:succinate dehydrogenase / fumarate reductase, membrane anchor subunit